ncbi:MAG: HDIG domain-containing protein [Clostridia bacterium]|nr:HDIG domain-containing protein [Clostridia bacterium]
MAKKIKRTNIKWRQMILSYLLAFILFSALTILPHIKEFTLLNAVVQAIMCAMLLVSIGLYVYFADRKVMESARETWAMFCTMILSYGIIQVYQLWGYAMYLVPFALCALILSIVVSGRCGFFANFIIIMLGFMEPVIWKGPQSIQSDANFYLLFSGVIETVFVSFLLGKQYRRSRYVLAGVILGFISAVCATISILIFDDLNSWSWVQFGIKIALSFASGMITVMFMFVILPIFEKLFNVSSIFRFTEIATSDNELMRKLFEKAPGTYNHCLTVATYVEACAVAIGQSAVIAKACAYYHDIGKLKNPSYFVENQFGGYNPHDNMTPEASVNMIKYHTLNGLAMAKDYGLPKEVQLAIVEHHGTLPIKYFFLKAQKYTDGFLPYDGYCYDGPKPTTKISAILMICDASEAALRASGDKNSADKIVNDIINERMQFGQFNDCDITMKELEIIKDTVVSTFLGVRHKRIEYPDAKLGGK